MIDIAEVDGDAVFSVKAVPRASRTAIAGEAEGLIRIRLAAPPVDGAANEELIKFLSKLFGRPRSAITIFSGEASRTKRIRVQGVSAAEARRILA